MSIKDKVKIYWNSYNSFLYFCEEVLGYKETDIYKDYKNLTDEHRQLCELLQDNKKHSKLILMPRFSFKSGIVTVAFSLWQMVRDPNVRILIYSDSATKAQGFLQGIKNHIEGKAPNSKFRDYYQNWETDPHKGKWNESQIVVRPRKISHKEPSVDTGGIESSKIGMHYDIIIFDDIVSDINTTTKAQMDKVHECYKKSLSLLKPGGDVVMVGTRWHYGDAYGRIISENIDKGNFEVFIRDAEEIKDGKLLFESIGLNREFLDYQRGEQGSYIYSCLYRNNPVDDETAIFKIEDFRYYDPNPSFHENMWITGTLDPAGEGDDFTAITVCGTDKDKNIYVLEAVNEHLKPNQIIDQIIRLNYKWGFDKFAVEKNYFKGLLESQLREAIHEESSGNSKFKPFSIEEVIASAKQRTFTRVLSLQPYHERNSIFLPGKSFNQLQKVYSELAFQMIQFTIDGSKSPHDDLLISLALHVAISHKGGEAKKEGPPETSAAWFELQQYEQLHSANSSVPIAYRHEFDEMAFN